MTFKFSDALVVGAIQIAGQGKDYCTLTDIIRTADYIDHSILTFSEFHNAAKKLIQIGLISDNKKKILTTKKFNDWWTKKYVTKKRLYLIKTIEQIKIYLDKTYSTIIDMTNEIELSVKEHDFKESEREYIELTKSVMTKLKN